MGVASALYLLCIVDSNWLASIQCVPQWIRRAWWYLYIRFWTGTDYYRTLLHRGAYYNRESDLHEVRPFIKMGLIDVDAREHFEQTALHRASFQGHVDMIRMLLELGADIDAQNAILDTSLHKAVRFCNMDAAVCLLEQGANPAIQNVIGLTPLEVARTREEVATLVLCLVAQYFAGHPQD